MDESVATEAMHPRGEVNLETIRIVIGRLIVRYGTGSWNAKFRDVDEETLQKDWFHALKDFPVASIDYGLENLPPDFLPNASQFRLICQRAPVRERAQPAIAAPKPDPVRLKQVFERMREITQSHRRPTMWIDLLQDRVAKGEHLNLYQQHCLDRAIENLSHRTHEVQITTEDSRRTEELKRSAAARVADYLRHHPELDPERA